MSVRCGRLARMKLSAGNLVVRANYLATAVFGMSLALFVIALTLPDLFDSLARGSMSNALALFVSIFLVVLPGARAIRRLIAIGTVIPPNLVSERPVVAWVVSLAGGAGHFFFVILMSAAIDIALLPEWPDDSGAPFVFVFYLASFSYLIALLCGELALVGDGVSDAARCAARP
jgi:hypothetical protein